MGSRLLFPLLGLAACLAVLPDAALARKAKSPFWAQVAANGTLVRSNGVVLVNRSLLYPAGAYEVYFERDDMTGCALVATTSDGSVGTVGTSVSPSVPYIVLVFTAAPNSALVDLPFHLVAHCPKR